jgi:hypothetical protein
LNIVHKMHVAKLTKTGIPEGRAIVFVEMMEQLNKLEKTLAEAAAVLREVGFTPAQADALVNVFKAISEAKGGKVAEHDFQTKRNIFTHGWSAPAVPPPIARRRGFFVVRNRDGDDADQ